MAMITKYLNRIGGLILDGIDIYLDVPRVNMHMLTRLDGGEPN